MDLFSRTYGAKTTPITAYRSGRNFVEVKGIQLVDWLRQGPTTDAFVRALNESLCSRPEWWCSEIKASWLGRTKWR